MDEFGRKKIEVSIVDETKLASTDIEKSLFDLNVQIDMLSPHADNVDYFISIASGILCAMLDILWVGEFDIQRGRELSEQQIDSFVVKVAKVLGYKGNDVKLEVDYNII